MVKFQQRRERVHQLKLQGAEVSAFFDALVTFLQSTATSAYSNSLRSTIAADLSLVDPSCHNELLRHLRAPLTATPDPKSKKAQPGPKAAFYYHEFTLDLIARLVIRINPDRYHAGVTELTKTLDGLVSQVDHRQPRVVRRPQRHHALLHGVPLHALHLLPHRSQAAPEPRHQSRRAQPPLFFLHAPRGAAQGAGRGG